MRCGEKFDFFCILQAVTLKMNTMNYFYIIINDKLTKEEINSWDLDAYETSNVVFAYRHRRKYKRLSCWKARDHLANILPLGVTVSVLYVKIYPLANISPFCVSVNAQCVKLYPLTNIFPFSVTVSVETYQDLDLECRLPISWSCYSMDLPSADIGEVI